MRLDIGWTDLFYGAAQCLRRIDPADAALRVEACWPEPHEAIACLSVRSGFDLLLSALELPRESDVLISAITIPHMVRIIEAHGLRPVPVDIDPATTIPRPDQLRRAITPQTRAVVIAPLFGVRAPLDAVATISHGHGLWLIEDAAQAFDGNYRGDPLAHVSMFSFGVIKTATAGGGALLRVRDRAVLERMRAIQAAMPLQSRSRYFSKLMKYAGLKLLSNPWCFRLFRAGCKCIGVDDDRLLSQSVRGFAGAELLTAIRHRPCAPLMALLARRLQSFEHRRLARRGELGRRLRDSLPLASCPAAAATGHSFWVFPVVTRNPRGLIEALKLAGFDATQGQSLRVVELSDRQHCPPDEARRMLSAIVFVPFYPELSARAVDRLAAAIRESMH
ncbi:MAG TPA: DegT/DnrJ/EryC1/StrS family aminotransferase [Pirellulales bacterium]|jgi:dTDP-4-amino-4,6-dideoxygalactose transaminase|nr:DegT/DnrJ/EryC1/StrS family aminotransferase [Pirellulales bacterium]